MSALFTQEQEDEIARIAEIRAAKLVAQALQGAAERIASAIVNGPVVVLPILHSDDIITDYRRASGGKVTHVSGGRHDA